MASTNTAVAPTTWARSIFSAFDEINWGEIATTVEQKSLGGAITTAEHVAEAIADALSKTNNPIAVEAKAVIPAAESMIGVVLNMVSAIHGASNPAPAAAAPAATAAAPQK